MSAGCMKTKKTLLEKRDLRYNDLCESTEERRERGMFPDPSSLAGASPKDVLGVWQGLGYNRQTPATKKQSSFANSDRQIRGAIVRVLLKEPVLARDELQQRADVEPARIERILSGMMGEGLVRAPGHDKTCEHNDKCKNHQSATDTE